MSLQLPIRRREPLRVDTSLAIVNIVLLLIFFFLVAGQQARPPQALKLAHTSQIAPGTLPSPVLEIRSAKDWLLDGVPILPELLPAALAGSDAPLHLMIDRDQQAGLLIEVLRLPGLADHQLRLVTLHDGERP